MSSRGVVVLAVVGLVCAADAASAAVVPTVAAPGVLETDTDADTLTAALVAGATWAGQQELLTEEEVEEILGLEVTVEERGAEGNSFTSSDPLGSVTIDIIDPAAIRMLQGNKESIEGLGEIAFFQLQMTNSVVLNVIDGGTAFILSVSFPMGPPADLGELDDLAVQLAEAALEEPSSS